MTVAIPKSAMAKVAAGMQAQIDRSKERSAGLDELYQSIIRTVTDKRQWQHGEQVDVTTGQHSGQPAGLYIKNRGGQLALHFWRGEGKRKYTSRALIVGVLLPLSGWQCTVLRTQFDAWRSQAYQAITK